MASVELLSEAWLARQRELTAELPERPGCSASINWEVTGGPDGAVAFHTVLEDGRIVASALEPLDEPDFTLLVPWDEFLAVSRGDLDASVGFMQGRIKVTGDLGRMLSVLPVTTGEPWRDVQRRLAAETSSS